MESKLSIPDQRMLQLMEYAVKEGLADNESQYWEKIGFPRTNLSNLRKGLQSFRIEHIRQACVVTGANANWILGIEKTMFREHKTKTALQLLKEATKSIEMEMAAKNKNKLSLVSASNKNSNKMI